MKTRAQAALVIQQVLDQGQSLSAVLPAAQEKVAPRDRALLQELCYGTLRWLPRLDAAVSEMMDKPLKNKSRIFHYLILVGLYQLIYTRIPAHAAVAETVNAVKLLKGTSLRGLINGVLRNFQRRHDELAAALDACGPLGQGVARADQAQHAVSYADYQGLRDSARLRLGLGIGGLVTAGVGIAGAVLLLRVPRSPSSFVLIPMATPGSVGLVLGGQR